MMAPSFPLLALFFYLCSYVSCHHPNHGDNVFDYIIVGGGTAGLVIASRLSRIPFISVAVVEAGHSVFDNPNVTSTQGFGQALNSSIDWQYRTVPQIYTNDRILTYNAGKALGGTSTINGMTYIRADAAQIDSWESLGSPNWNWRALIPYYRRSETFQFPSHNDEDKGATFDPAAHGVKGPVNIGWNNHLMAQEIFIMVNRTWANLKIPYNHDANNGRTHGLYIWPSTVDKTLDIREDAARAYFYPIAGRPNLKVYTNTLALRLKWANISSSVSSRAIASGVEVLLSNNSTTTLTAIQEVILAAGSIRSSSLLEHSGIGDPRLLRKHGIPPKVPLPAVGEGLQDQPNVFILASTNVSFSGESAYCTFVTAADLFGAAITDEEARLRAAIKGYAASISAASNRVVDPEALERIYSLQADLIFKHNVTIGELITVPMPSGIGIAFWPLLPFSRGSVHVASRTATAAPDIDPRFLMLEFDKDILVALAKLGRRVFSTNPIAEYVGKELIPGLGAVPLNANSSVWMNWLKSSYTPNAHPLGILSLAARELGGVVDTELRVYGTQNVRVVDASVIPGQISGHLSATVYAIAERAAEMMLRDLRGRGI
ncbi:GMC oxidoreductase [Patellaria atrata CBS 101060]|uniref:GMC oxidoreductase n=1 Tax=Patellaria atrata CBS 101060 TaxID=1346257 RepID=A0A9P4SG96_9PEZI|nr:GMC oxidoreductase [Patellaria atrata CBS 101060]